MAWVLADCVDPGRCHVITSLPWYFGVAIAVVWLTAVLGIGALVWRRRARRRAERRQEWHGGALERLGLPAPPAERER